MTTFTSGKKDNLPSENPVLYGFRIGGVTIADAFAAMDLAESWNNDENPEIHDPEWTNEHITHARKVLTHLAVLRDEPIS